MGFLSKFKLSDNLLVALVPIFGYFAAYFNEYSRFNNFNVPTEYIQIGIEKVILSSFYTFFFLFFLYLGILIFNALLKSTNKKGKSQNKSSITKDTLGEYVFITIVFPTLIFLILYLSTNFNLFFMTGMSSLIMVLISSIAFLPPLLKYHDIKNYKQTFNKYQEYVYQKRIKQAKKEKDRKPFSISLLPSPDHPFFNYSVITLGLLVWTVASLVLGSVNSNKIYPIIKENEKEYILFGSYNSQLVLVGIDSKKRKTNSEIILMNDGENKIIEMKNIGIINEVKSDSRSYLKFRSL